MKLPWDNSELKNRIEELEEEVEELEEEKLRMENRFEAEKERRSELARQKQEAEKRINKLEQKLETRKENSEKAEEEVEPDEKKASLTLSEVKSGIQKLESLDSEQKDLLTVYSPGEFSEIGGLRDLKNSASKVIVEDMEDREAFVRFTDETFIDVLIEARPFFDSHWSMENSFEVKTLQEFIESQKTWVVASAGNTRIIEEEDGEVHEIENVKTRVDRKHSQGGFSQDRFERKREEQISNHIEAVEEEMDSDEALLVGDRKLCQQLPGEYLGGFDDNRPLLDALYSFRLVS